MLNDGLVSPMRIDSITYDLIDDIDGMELNMQPDQHVFLQVHKCGSRLGLREWFLTCMLISNVQDSLLSFRPLLSFSLICCYTRN